MSESTPRRRPRLKFERNLAMIFALLATLVVGLITLHWFLVLEPTLRTDALSRSRVLAQAQANTIEQRLDGEQEDLLRMDLEATLGGLLLLKDQATEQPFVRRITLRMDYDHFQGPKGSLDLASGVDQCPECFISEIPLYHPHNRQLIGIATFYTSPKALETLIAGFRTKLLWGAGALLWVIGLTWGGAGRLLRRLGESETNLHNLFEAAPFPMVLRKLGAARLSQANQAGKDYLGLGEDDEGYWSSKAWRTLEGQGLPVTAEEHCETPILHPEGDERWALVSVRPLQVAEGASELVSLVDISELKTIQRELRLASLTDSLTGLHNRHHLFLMLTEQIERTKRCTYRFSIALFDLDHFKAINDTYGHRVGDEVLIRVAAALRRSVREFDIVGRYGGEEFMLILPHTDLLEASVIAERVRAGVKDLTWPGSPLSVTLSGGVCAYAGTNLDDLVDEVDQKLYAAKAAGRDRIIG